MTGYCECLWLVSLEVQNKPHKFSYHETVNLQLWVGRLDYFVVWKKISFTLQQHITSHPLLSTRINQFGWVPSLHFLWNMCVWAYSNLYGINCICDFFAMLSFQGSFNAWNIFNKSLYNYIVSPHRRRPNCENLQKFSHVYNIGSLLRTESDPRSSSWNEPQ